MKIPAQDDPSLSLPSLRARKGHISDQQSVLWSIISVARVSDSSPG